MHIHHLTLTTGHTRFSPRSEVAQWAINFIKPVVIVGGGELGDTGWRIRMVRGTQPGERRLNAITARPGSYPATWHG
jgi:hypothetical protein